MSSGYNLKTHYMSDNKYFKAALSDFAFDAAFGDSIRHLHNSGYTPEEIYKYLDSGSLSVDRIRDVIRRYEDTRNDNDGSYEYVKEYDSYGRASFIKRKADKGSGPDLT